jgi:penicillin-binding protein 1B
VWVGLDRGGSTGLTGAQGALPIWTEFVRALPSASGATDFSVPDDVVWHDVDPLSGGLATSGCPVVRRAPFLVGVEPHGPCDLHRPAWADVGDEVEDAMRNGGRRLRGWFEDLFR